MTNNIKDISPRYKAIILLTIAGIVVAGSVIVMLVVVRPRLITVRTTIEDQQRQAALQQSSTSNLISAQQRLDEIANELIELNAAFIPKDQPLEALRQFELLAAQRDVEVELALSDPASADVDDILEVPMQLSINGGFINSLEYLNDIITQPFYIRFEEVNISAPSDSSLQPDIITITIQANLYWK